MILGRRALAILLLVVAVAMVTRLAAASMAVGWVLVAAAVVGAAIGVGWQWWSNRPIIHFTHLLKRLNAGDRDARLLPTSNDAHGAMLTQFNSLRDKERAELLQLSNERRRRRTIMERMSDAVITTDRHGIVDTINAAALDLLDIEAKDAIGYAVAQVLRHHELIALWQRAHDTDEPIRSVVEMSRGGLFVDVAIMPLNTVDLDGFVVMLHDYTEVRRLETVRRDFISNLSHELRTPLASLQALVETLQDGALDDRPMAEHFLNRSAQEVDTLTQMVVELLELARIESGKVPLQLKPTTVAEIIMPAYERLALQAERQAVTLVVDISADCPSILADGPRLSQVVANLIHNAVKFTPSDGTVHISAFVSDNAKGSEPTCTIQVTDTGIGIPSYDLDRIFERFYKVDRARTASGTGLGLAISKHIVQTHGGEIWAHSTEGRGSTFAFTIPLDAQNQTKPL